MSRNDQIIDTDTGLPALYKKPSEEKTLDFDASPIMRDSDTISSVTNVTAVNLGRVPGSGDITINNPTHNMDKLMQARFLGGTDGEGYHVTWQFVTAGGDVREGDSVLLVQEDF